MRKSFMVALILLVINAVAFTAYAQEDMYLTGEEYSGYVVTLKNAEYEEGEASLFGESVIPDDMTNEELVSFVEDNVDTAKSLIPEISMITVEDEETLQALIAAGLVESYDPDYYMQLMGYDYTENPVFSVQWGHQYINSSYAWNAGIFGNDVKVAVIDSGVYPHNDLKNNLLPGKNYAGGDETDTTDTLGHGTFVAGIIAAECNNIATVGLAHRAKIVPLKVTDGQNFKMSLAISAMKDAVDLFDCDVINMSLGSTTASTELKNAVDYVVSKEAGGVILVAAAGNGGNSTYVYPASYDSVISVANAQKSGSTLIIRSTSTHNDMVDIAAPGSSVYSLAKTATGYTSNSGTSFAAPYVSAAAALAKSIMPEINQPQFNMSLWYSANTSYITETQGSEYWGYGLLDVKELIKFLLLMKCSDTGFYISPADKQLYGDNTSLYITNLKSTYTDFGNLFLYNYVTNSVGATRLNSVKVLPVKLDVDSSVEISLTDLGLDGEVKYTVLSKKLKPLIGPVRTVTVD